MSCEKLYSLYSAASVSVRKVLDLMLEPEFTNVMQQDVWVFLRKFIGSMNTIELRAFLRFVTGSVVICVNQITVTFNSIQGLARRPIGHTCLQYTRAINIL